MVVLGLLLRKYLTNPREEPDAADITYAFWQVKHRGEDSLQDVHYPLRVFISITG